MKALEIVRTERADKAARYTVRAIVRDSNSALKVATFNARIAQDSNYHLTSFVYSESRKLRAIAKAFDQDRLNDFLMTVEQLLFRAYRSDTERQLSAF
jgi:hypothetical protein